MIFFLQIWLSWTQTWIQIRIQVQVPFDRLLKSSIFVSDKFCMFFVSIFHILFHFIFHSYFLNFAIHKIDKIIFDFAKLVHKISRKFGENVWFRFCEISRNFQSFRQNLVFRKILKWCFVTTLSGTSVGHSLNPHSLSMKTFLVTLSL